MLKFNIMQWCRNVFEDTWNKKSLKFCLRLGGDNIQKKDILKALFQNMVGICPHVPIRSSYICVYKDWKKN